MFIKLEDIDLHAAIPRQVHLALTGYVHLYLLLCVTDDSDCSNGTVLRLLGLFSTLFSLLCRGGPMLKRVIDEKLIFLTGPSASATLTK